MDDCTCNRRIRLAGTGSSRREFLARCGLGVGSLGLASLLTEEMLAAALAGRTRPEPTHFPAKASHVIHIFARGAPSQVDTWDPKPALHEIRRPDAPRPERRGDGVAVQVHASTASRASKSARCSPAIAAHVDDLAVIRSM